MKPDFLIFNGCSFTEGGGLSNRFILNQYGYDTPLDVNVEYHNIKNELRFSKLVSKHFNCDYVNLAESCNSNDNIFQSIFDYVESNTRKKAEEDAKLAIILGSKWLRDKKITKRGLKRILDGEMMLKDEDMIEIEKIKKSVGWGQNIPLNKLKSIKN